MKQSKQDLLRLLNAYQQAVDLNLICSITDPEGKIIYANSKFCEVSGFTEKELIGQNHSIVNSGFHSKEFFKSMWDTIKSGNIWQGDVKSKRKDGSYFWLHSAILPVFDENGKIVQYFSLRFSIDERKQAEEECTEHIQLLEELLFKTSHRVRQPIADIIGISTLLEDPDLSREDLKSIAGYMKQSVLSLDAFTQELTKFIYENYKKNKDNLLNIKG